MNGVLEIVGVNAVGATLLAGVVASMSRFVTRPAVVHGLWLLVLVELVSLPVFGVVILQMPARAIAQPGSVTAAAESVALFPWRAIVTTTWLGGALLVLALALSRSLRFSRLLGTTSQAPASFATAAAGLASRLGVSPCPEVRVVPAAISPMLWFPGRSLQILLPAALLRRLAPLELQALVAHELAHVCRRDHWVRRFELLVGALFWWHPVTWWARRAMRKAEEESCDAWVVHALPGHARAYAEGLLKTVEFVVDARTPVPAFACGAGTRHVRERLTMIMQKRVADPSSRWQRRVLAVAAAVLLFVVPTIGTATLPAQTQDTHPDERILVTVNGHPVTQADLQLAQTRALREEGSPQSDAERQQVVQQRTPGLIANAVDELLLVQWGRELGYALAEEQFQTVVDRIKEENNFDDEQLVTRLQEAEGMTLPELRDVMERQWLAGRAQQDMGQDYDEVLKTLRNQASMEWEDDGLKGLYDEYLGIRPQP